MGLVSCERCEGCGRVCPKCGKPWGTSGNLKDPFTGQLKNKHRRRYGGCGVKRGASLPCPEHVDTYIECDFGGERGVPSHSPARVPVGWTLETAPGSHVPGYCCPTCLGAMRIGLDFALEGKGSAQDIIEQQWSIGCGWAMHLGQYEDAARAEQWDRVDLEQPAATAPTRLRDWRSADFIDPTTKGRYGWGRWSQVRRDAAAAPPIVHVLDGGRSLCGGFDGRNPDAAAWVRLNTWQTATCETCRHIALAMFNGAAA